MLRRRSTYKPLDTQDRQIRLLQLQPGCDREELIQCQTRTVSLDSEDLFYDALSYVWGDPSSRRTIILDDEEHEVTANLYEVLINVRDTQHERIVWIDALSINQEDLLERSRQVPLMYDIYARASTVIIYLGSAYAGIDLAWSFFELVGQNINNHVDAKLTPNILNNILDITSHEVVHAVSRFVSSPWFTRIWTAQEWHVARKSTIQCSRQIIDADLVFSAAFYFCGHTSTCCSAIRILEAGSWLHEALTPLATMIMRRDNTNNAAISKDEDFLSLIAAFRTRNASDPRDKLYGLLAIAGTMERHIVRVDYTKEPEDIYTQWAVSTMKMSNSLDIFSFVISHEGTLSLPSWVPDWTTPMDSQLAAQMESRRRLTLPHMYNACAGRPLEFRDDDRKLIVQGRIVTSIATVASDVISLTRNLSYKFEVAPEVEAVWAKFVEPYLHDELESRRRQAVFWMTICGGVKVDPLTMRYERRSSMGSFNDLQEWRSWIWSQNQGDVPSQDVNLVMNAISTTFAGRTLAILDNDSLGWVPIGSRATDVVAVLTGGRVPIVLKPVADGYTVLGDAYIQGIMDGEALDDNAQMEAIMLV